MNPQCQTAMKDAISKVLETMFFATALFEDADEPKTGEDLPYQYESRINIHGDRKVITLFCLSSDRFARMITADFLGVKEDQLSLQEIEDAMKELANMVAGELASRLGEELWRLSIPAFEEMKGAAKQYPGKSMASIRLLDDDGPLALALCRWDDTAK
jgi:CheY-specific phosphatase CheX